MASGAQMASAPKAWSQLSDEDKFNRLRSIIKAHQRETRAMAATLARYKTFVEEHAHDANGSPTVTIIGAENEVERVSDKSVPTPAAEWGWADGPQDDDAYF